MDIKIVSSLGLCGVKRFPEGWVSLHSCQQWMRISVSLHPYQHSGLLVFLILPILVEVSTCAYNMHLANAY